METLKLMIGLFWSFISVFVVCELSERLTIRCETFEDAFCRWQWYLFPIEMQKLLTIAIANAQQTLVIKGYGNVPCTRETFKTVSGTLIFNSLESHSLLSFYFVLLSGGEDMPFLFHGITSNGWIKK